jgi:hypothetical protein
MLGNIEADPTGERPRRNRRRLGWAVIAMVPLTWAATALPGPWAWLAIVPVVAFWAGVAVLYAFRS